MRKLTNTISCRKEYKAPFCEFGSCVEASIICTSAGGEIEDMGSNDYDDLIWGLN